MQRGRGRGGVSRGGMGRGYPPPVDTSFYPQSPSAPHSFGPRGGAPNYPPGSKPPLKLASNVEFNGGMLLKVMSFARPEESAGPLSAFALSSPGPVRVFTGDVNGNLREFECDSGVWRQSRIAKHEGPVTAVLAVDVWLFVGVDVRDAGTGAMLGVVKVYNLATNAEMRLVTNATTMPAAHFLSVRCMCAAPPYLITGGADGQIKAWKLDPAAGWVSHGVYGGTGGAHPNLGVITVKPVGTDALVSGSTTGTLKIWGLTNGNEMAAVQAHIGDIGAVDVITVNGSSFITTAGSNDTAIRLWGFPTLQPLYELRIGSNPNIVNPISALKTIVSPTQQHFLFIGFRNGSAQVWLMKDSSNFVKLGAIDGHERKSRVMGFDTSAAAGNMVCLVTDRGDVNWFALRPYTQQHHQQHQHHHAQR